MTEATLRQAVVAACQGLQPLGLGSGTAGNISVRHGEGLLISPTGIDYDQLTPDQVVALRWDGSFDGPVAPSSEWRFHRDILRARPDLNAVVHTHSPHATAVAILRRGIPPIHYAICAAGGDIRCAPYHLFGTQALADAVLEALQNRRACLLAHHGAIATHATLDGALALAQTVEDLARQYLLCLPMGEPPVLTTDQIAEAMDRIRTYGQQPAAGTGDVSRSSPPPGP